MRVVCAKSGNIATRVSEDAAKAIASQGIDQSEAEIARIATRVANSHKFFEEDYGEIRINARYDVAQGLLFLDPGIRFGPRSIYPDMEDLHWSVYLAVEPIAKLLPNYQAMEWLYGGFDLYHWFPQDRRQEGAKASSRRGGFASGEGLLISAGHGYYYHHGYKDWRPQREVHNGILEDEITTRYTATLTTELNRYGHIVNFTRPEVPGFIHEPSRQPYQMMAARYHLADLVPHLPEIWHSLPNSTDPLREYLEDIRSRPLYANALGADEIIHLHTNASDADSERGATVIVQRDRPKDAQLGNLVLCYMKEHIHSLPEYASFPVAVTSKPLNKGENRLAQMPSIIIEVAFHTNPQDAAALKDARFETLAMRGAAKGYRLYKQGKDCATFSMSAPEQSAGIGGQRVTIPMTFAGNPDFPVALSVYEKGCTGFNCHTGSWVFYRKEDFEGYTHSFLCGDGDSFRPEVTLFAMAHDQEGIETPEVVHKVRCQPKPVSADLALN